MERTTTLLLAVLAAIPMAFAQDIKSLPGDESGPVSPEELAKLVRGCEGCHGPGGVSTREEVPSLAGRPAAELLDEIERFYFFERDCPDVASGEEGNHLSMCDVTDRLSREEAQALSRHFEAQIPES